MIVSWLEGLIMMSITLSLFRTRRKRTMSTSHPGKISWVEEHSSYNIFDVLNTKVLFLLFREHCLKEFSVENINFVVQVVLFKRKVLNLKGAHQMAMDFESPNAIDSVPPNHTKLQELHMDFIEDGEYGPLSLEQHAYMIYNRFLRVGVSEYVNSLTPEERENVDAEMRLVDLNTTAVGNHMPLIDQ